MQKYINSNYTIVKTLKTIFLFLSIGRTNTITHSK